MAAPDDDVESPPEPAPRRSIARNAAGLLASQVITWSIAFVVSAVQPRLLGPAGQGELRVGYAAWGLAQVAISLGTTHYIILSIARSTADRDLLGRVLGVRLLAYICSLGPVAVFAVTSGTTGAEALVFLFLGIATLFNIIGGVYGAALVGIEHMRFTAIADAVSKLVQAIVVISLLVAGFGVGGVAAVQALASALSALILRSACRRLVRRPVRPTLRGGRRLVRDASGYLAADATLTVYQQVDTFVMSYMLSNRELGWYGTALNLFGSLSFIPGILLSSFYPVVGRLHVEDPARLRTLVTRMFGALMLLAVPISVGTVLVAPTVTHLLFGDEFRKSAPVLAVFGAVVVFVYGTSLFGGIALGTGRQAFWNRLMVLSVLLSIGLDIVLVPFMQDHFSNGALAGGLSFLATELLMFCVGLFRFAPYLLRGGGGRRLAATLCAGGLMAGVMWPVRHVLPVVPLALGLVVYGLAAVALRAVDPQIMAEISKRAHSLISRGRARTQEGA